MKITLRLRKFLLKFNVKVEKWYKRIEIMTRYRVIGPVHGEELKFETEAQEATMTIDSTKFTINIQVWSNGRFYKEKF